MYKLLMGLLISFSSLYPHISSAELTIEITQGVETAIPIAIVPFAQPTVTDTQVANVIRADLKRSGYFKNLPKADMLTKPIRSEEVNYRNWRVLGQDYLLIGQVLQQTNHYQVKFQLFDVYQGISLLGYQLDVPTDQLRQAAHRISDLVYEKLTGKKGVFSTRIAYVTRLQKNNRPKRYQLQVSDADGFNPITITTSSEPIMSPAWSPDGKKIAYVSFESGRSRIYIQTLATGKRIKVASYRGINGAPAFSPDGNRLALTLSKDGSPDIYSLNLLTHSLVKLTRSYGIETEPSWSPDGKTILYTSNRGGKPQLYMIPSNGGVPRRLTFEGEYNASGQFSADGQQVVMVHANQGDYRIAVLDLKTRTINVLSAGKFDESPSFSANGEMILFATKKGNKSVLSAVSVDGRMQQSLALSQGDVREPAWSP